MNEIIRRALAPFTFDGTEAHRIINDLTDAVTDAKGDVALVFAARVVALRRLYALLKDTVPVEAVLDAMARLQEDQRPNFDFGEVPRGFVKQQIRIRANERDKGKEI